MIVWPITMKTPVQQGTFVPSPSHISASTRKMIPSHPPTAIPSKGNGLSTHPQLEALLGIKDKGHLCMLSPRLPVFVHSTQTLGVCSIKSNPHILLAIAPSGGHVAFPRGGVPTGEVRLLVFRPVLWLHPTACTQPLLCVQSYMELVVEQFALAIVKHASDLRVEQDLPLCGEDSVFFEAEESGATSPSREWAKSPARSEDVFTSHAEAVQFCAVTTPRSRPCPNRTATPHTASSRSSRHVRVHRVRVPSLANVLG